MKTKGAWNGSYPVAVAAAAADYDYDYDNDDDDDDEDDDDYDGGDDVKINNSIPISKQNASAMWIKNHHLLMLCWIQK
jgi:hypothetical protein